VHQVVTYISKLVTTRLPCGKRILVGSKLGYHVIEHVTKMRKYEFTVIIPGNIFNFIELDYKSLDTFLDSDNSMDLAYHKDDGFAV
jgi:hypothetical protein